MIRIWWTQFNPLQAVSGSGASCSGFSFFPIPAGSPHGASWERLRLPGQGQVSRTMACDGRLQPRGLRQHQISTRRTPAAGH